MQILRDDFSGFEGQTVLTIGNFDGLHRAHVALLDQVIARARALSVKSGMVTFDPHPMTVIRPDAAPPLLTTLDEKILLLEEIGLDVLALYTFNRELMQTRAAAFLQQLHDNLRPLELWVGRDFAMGYKREGTVEFIRQWAEPRGIAVRPIELIEIDGEVIGSSRIRALLADGDVAGAARLLGRPPSVTGVVRQGDQRGRTIGFPTANVIPGPHHALPANGVYATRTTLPDGQVIPGVTNVGVRPTFGGQQRQVESFLFDWDGDLYGETITVHFLHRLREERRFPSLDALLAQIRADAEEARQLLTQDGSSSTPLR